MSAKMRLAEAPSNSGALLKETAGQILEKMAEADRLKEDLADLWAGAKDAGIEVKALKPVIDEMRDEKKLAAHLAHEEVVDRYRQQLGLIGEGADVHTAKVQAIAAHLQAKGFNVRAGD